MTLGTAETQPWRILLVDDNPLDRADARAALLNGASRPYHFTEAALVSEALQLCAQAPPYACMVLDFHLPDGDAGDVLSQLPCDADGMPCLPVVILTGVSGNTSRATLRSGAQDYVGKAWLGPESLTWAVENAIERRKIAREVIAERLAIDTQRLYLFEAERMARQESERVTLLKDEFLATLSHELRTPLAAIVGWAQILQHAQDNPLTVRRGVDAIVRNGNLQAKLIEDLLDMNRIVSGKLLLDLQLVDIATLVSAAVETLRPLAVLKGVAMTIAALGAPLPRVRGDAVRLQQIFANLLTNALKFTAAGGTITIACSATDGTLLEVLVVDDGEGIDEQFIPHLFDRFSQANSKAARVHGGLGIGLSIVKQLTELHGGVVTGASPGVGLGATFRVVLPGVLENTFGGDGAALSVSGDEHENVDHIDLRGTSVLLVDDNIDMLELSRRLLSEHGAAVATVTSAAAALTYLRSTVPDVLVSDISMPEMDGYELIRAIRTGLGLDNQALPAVALSAFARVQDQHRALDAGYQDYLFKPLRPHLLIQTVARLAGGL